MSLDHEIVVEALPTYDVGDELGRGAYGIVLSGEHKTLGRAVAIKQLPRAFGSDPEVRKRFLAEARVLASMDHPHIVPIFDFVERDGVCLLVMERLGGGTLWSRMQDGSIDDRFAVASALAAATGLEYAQRRGVLHRDIKPENLMFNGDGVLKVTDFGIAKVVGQGLTMATRAGYALGTPAYMAPEQAQGLELGPATDVYALGTVLYEMLAGELPYRATTDPVAALYQHVHEDPRPLAEIAPATPPAIAQVVDRAVARSLEVRYATPNDLKTALAQAADTAWGPGWADAPGLPLRQLTAMPPSSGGAPGTVNVAGAPTIAEAQLDGAPAGGGRGRMLLLVAAVVVVLGGIGAVLASRSGGSHGTAATGGSTSTTAATARIPAAGFIAAPLTAPVGGTITVSSAKVCPAPPTQDVGPTTVYIQMVDPRQVTAQEDGTVLGQHVDVDAHKAWTAQVVVPGDTTPGPVRIHTQCFSHDPQYEQAGPYFDYPADVTLTVTAAG